MVLLSKKTPAKINCCNCCSGGAAISWYSTPQIHFTFRAPPPPSLTLHCSHFAFPRSVVIFLLASAVSCVLYSFFDQISLWVFDFRTAECFWASIFCCRSAGWEWFHCLGIVWLPFWVHIFLCFGKNICIGLSFFSNSASASKNVNQTVLLHSLEYVGVFDNENNECFYLWKVVNY